MTDKPNSGEGRSDQRPEKREGQAEGFSTGAGGAARGTRGELQLKPASIQSPLLVRIVERRPEAIVVENRRGEGVAIHPSIFRDNRIDPGLVELILPEGVYRHCFGREAVKLMEAQEEADRTLIRDWFSLLLENQSRVIQDSWLSACYSPAWRIGGYPVGGADFLSLGLLERLWAEGSLRMECPGCGGTAYIGYITGSYLSGRNTAQGFCPGCGCFVCRRSPAGRSLGQFRRAINDASQLLYLGGGAPLRPGRFGRPPRLLYPKELEAPNVGAPSLEMVTEELAKASR